MDQALVMRERVGDQMLAIEAGEKSRPGRPRCEPVA
jgi:hypothetical protein